MKVVIARSVCAIALLVLMATLFLEWSQPQAYSRGMVLRPGMLSRAGIHVERYGVDLAGLTDKGIESIAVAGIYDSDCGLYLEVNTSNRILKIQRWKWMGVDFLMLIERLKQIHD